MFRHFCLLVSAVVLSVVLSVHSSPAQADVCGSKPMPPAKIITFHTPEFESVPTLRKIATDLGAADMSTNYQRVLFRFTSPVSGTVHVTLGDSGLYQSLVAAMNNEGWTLDYSTPGAYIEGWTK